MVNSSLVSCQPAREVGDGGLNQSLLGRDDGDGSGGGHRTQDGEVLWAPPTTRPLVFCPSQAPRQRSTRLGWEGGSPDQALEESGDVLGGDTLLPEPFSGSLCSHPSHIYSPTPLPQGYGPRGSHPSSPGNLWLLGPPKSFPRPGN